MTSLAGKIGGVGDLCASTGAIALNRFGMGSFLRGAGGRVVMGVEETLGLDRSLFIGTMISSSSSTAAISLWKRSSLLSSSWVEADSDSDDDVNSACRL